MHHNLLKIYEPWLSAFEYVTISEPPPYKSGRLRAAVEQPFHIYFIMKILKNLEGILTA